MKYNNMPKEEAFFLIESNISNMIFETQEQLLKKPNMVLNINEDIHLSVYMLSDIKNLSYQGIYKLAKKVLKNQ